MSANINPIFTKIGQIDWSPAVVSAANTAKDGTGTVTTVFTADAANGGYIQKIRFKPAGTNVATVARIFINNGATNATASNNILFDDVTLGPTTLSETASMQTYEIPLNISLPPGYKINVVLGTAVASGYYVTGVGGKY